MSGQYPPPNPAHHQRAPPSQNLMPPWGHPPQPSGMNVVGSSMNFYGSPHMRLPGRGAQPWLPPQTHPKPPSTANPLFGLQMLMAPEGGQRIPSEYQQEETMDLSSHSSTAPDVPKTSVRSENSDLLHNGAILAPEVNGDMDRIEAEVKDSIVTSVIAPNPLRERVPDVLNCCKVTESSVVRRVETTMLSEGLMRGVDTCEIECMRSSNSTDFSEPALESFVSPIVKAATNTMEPDIKSELTSSDRLDGVSAGKVVEKTGEESLQSLDALSKSVGGFESAPKNVDKFNVNESQTSLFDNSTLSVDTDDSKLVVDQSSTEDIFGISPVGDSMMLITQGTEKSEQSNGTPVMATKVVPDKIVEATSISLATNDHWVSRPNLTVAPPIADTEPHPSVENVEILLESMFNSQEESSCSLQNINNGVPQSVIVSNGTKMPTEALRPQVDMTTPMKEEELAMTLAEDNPVVVEVKRESREEPVAHNFTDEVEKKLELLTESSSSEEAKFDGQAKVESSIPEPVKEDPSSNNNDVEKESVDVAFISNEPNHAEGGKPSESIVDLVLSVPKPEVGSSNNPFIEVETQLEKMFAGIVEPMDEVGSDNPSQPSVSEPKRPAVNKKSITKRKKANSRRPSDNSVFGGSSGDSTPVKKKGRKRVTDSGSERGSKKMKMDSTEGLKKGKTVKDVASDSSLSGKVKGPFVHIEGSKESPASVVVVNSGVRADDEEGADKTSARRKHSTLQRPEGSRRSGPVYNSSTLSMRYNSDTADLSWVCVFCKRGPHCTGAEPAGDLFGPYRIPVTPPWDEAMVSGIPTDKDVVEEQKRRGGKHPKSLRASGVADLFIQKMAKKNKRSMSSDTTEPQPGLLPVDGGYEVWLHGNCAEWAPGLCIIGTQLVGLEDAIWTALRTRCTNCGETGAGIGCVVRNCPIRVHYHCAVLCGWLLDTDTFIARCQSHRTRPRPS